MNSITVYRRGLVHDFYIGDGKPSAVIEGKFPLFHSVETAITTWGGLTGSNNIYPEWPRNLDCNAPSLEEKEHSGLIYVIQTWKTRRYSVSPRWDSTVEQIIVSLRTQEVKGSVLEEERRGWSLLSVIDEGGREKPLYLEQPNDACLDDDNEFMLYPAVPREYSPSAWRTI